MKAKKFLIYKQNKMLKVKNFIKNTPLGYIIHNNAETY